MAIYTERICSFCNKAYKRRLNQTHHENINSTFCSQKCCGLSRYNTIIEKCGYCGKLTTTKPSIKKKSKSGLCFCNASCSASYNNKLRIKTRRSKCEILLYNLLIKEFPQLNILPNDKLMLSGCEVHIAIPSLQLAIEWNGTVHFKPIYGTEQLLKIQARDKNKLELASKLNINLIVIPDLVSTNKYVYKCFEDIKLIINDLIKQKA